MECEKCGTERILDVLMQLYQPRPKSALNLECDSPMGQL